MQEALHNFSGTTSINGRENSNLRFADDIDLIAGTEEDLQELTTTLERRAHAYGMEISAEKSKSMVNSRRRYKDLQQQWKGESVLMQWK